ncbi:MAG: LysM peptidoglycan-binding domain-containing protein [Anaerolineae bacterium]|nr:LysM peptidoglycan-binding domain-containing protein [Anaerolineae bacterium]
MPYCTPATASSCAWARGRPRPRPTAPTTHVVQEGESLWTVAARHGLTVEALCALNGLSDDAVIRPGQTLKLREPEPTPTATATETPRPTASPTPQATAIAARPSATSASTTTPPATPTGTTAPVPEASGDGVRAILGAIAVLALVMFAGAAVHLLVRRRRTP